MNVEKIEIMGDSSSNIQFPKTESINVSTPGKNEELAKIQPYARALSRLLLKMR